MRPRLALKLVLSMTVTLAVVEGIAQVVSVRRQERRLLDAVTLGADQLSRSITGATWQAMLSDHREAAYQVMQTIADKKGVDHVRMFNRDGTLMFATDRPAGGAVDMRDEVCSPCHSGAKPLVRLSVDSRARVYTGAERRRRLAMVTPIYNEPACSTADCHAHPAQIRVLGVLDVGIDLQLVDDELATMRRQTVTTAIVEIALISLIVFGFTAHFVSAPVHRLIAATRAISEKRLGQPVAVGTRDELGELAVSIDLMRQRLLAAQEEDRRFTLRLEEAIRERTRQLDSAHQKLVQSDRLASLGQLAASVAHEINNPLSGVLNLVRLVQRVVEKEQRIPPDRMDEVLGYLRQAADETTRVGRIVADLLTFSRQSRRLAAPTDLNAVVAQTVSLISHKLVLGAVGLDLQLQDDLPPVPCDASQIQQVVMNLVLNAAEATTSGGTVSVRTSVASDRTTVRLVVEDTGCGMPGEVLDHIFDPFFTTKEEGKSVGLGLALVYGIVKDHGGDVEVTTRVGEGSRFTVVLPLEARVRAGESPTSGNAA